MEEDTFEEWCAPDALVPPAGMRERWLACAGLPVTPLEPGKKLREIDRSEVGANEWEEVEKDVARAMWWWSTDDADVVAKQQALRRVLLHTLLRGRGRWHYFQGLHDLASVLVLVLGEQSAADVLERLAEHKLAAWFQRGIEPIVDIIGNVLPLLRLADPPLFGAIDRSGVAALFCIGWVITWFTHDVEDPQAAYLLVDALCGAAGSDDRAAERLVVYMCAAFISLVRDKVLALPAEKTAQHHFFTSEMPLLQSHPSSPPPPSTAAGERLSKARKHEEQRESMDVHALLERARQLQSAWSWERVQKSRQEYGRSAMGDLGDAPTRPKLPETAVKKRMALLKHKAAVPVAVGVAVGVVSVFAAVVASIATKH